MSLKATIYKAQLQIADMDRALYADHALTLALHPSETEERLLVRLRELAFLNSGVKLLLTDLRGSEPVSVDLHYPGGLSAFVTWLDRCDGCSFSLSFAPLHGCFTVELDLILSN